MTPQQAEFAARVARIEAGGAKRKPTIFVGPDETYVIDLQRVTRPSGGLTLIRNAAYPLSMVVAFAIGCLAYVMALFVRFQMAGAADTPFDPDMEMAINLASGLTISLLIGQVDQLRGSEQKIAKALGVIFCMLTFHNLVHLYPDLFAVMFSKLWVTKLISSTKAYSLLWRGISFTL